MDLYLKILAENKIDPNFWCSREYLRAAKVLQVKQEDWVWLHDGDKMMFPPLHIHHGQRMDSMPWLENGFIWAGFNDTLIPGAVNRILDYNFIYDPARFVKMDGSGFSKFRKNSRKWPRRTEAKSQYVRTQPGEYWWKDSINDMVVRWLGGIGEDTQVHDSDILVDYIHNAQFRSILIRGGDVVGMNIWDYSWKYVNYRYMLCRPEPYLDEYMRLLFYKDIVAISPGMMVNDGGTLDREGLYKFKESLQPVKIQKIFSWHEIGERYED